MGVARLRRPAQGIPGLFRPEEGKSEEKQKKREEDSHLLPFSAAASRASSLA